MTKKVKAVFTVEAAAVMLLTILTIFSLMSLSLWLRERVILSSVLTESLYCRNRQEAEQCLNRAKEKIFASDSSLALDSFDEYTVQASGSGNMAAVGLPRKLLFLGDNREEICPAVRFCSCIEQCRISFPRRKAVKMEVRYQRELNENYLVLEDTCPGDEYAVRMLGRK